MRVQDFFQNYLIRPFSPELTKIQRAAVFLASSILGIMTLGLLHCSMYYLRQKKITAYDTQSKHLFKANFQALKRTHDVAARVLDVEADFEKGPYGHDNVRRGVQQFVQTYYKRPLPPFNEIMVAIPEGEPLLEDLSGQTVCYAELNREQKIALINHFALPHNRVHLEAPEFMVDRHFLASAAGHQHSDFLPNDPKEHHGVDHAVRASILAASFGYLYAKYHPQADHIDLKQIRLAQLTAAGHDSARQTEGPDIYDDTSAEYTVDGLKGLGFEEEAEALESAHDAVAAKDASPEDLGKTFVAKCVQCADCAEYSRLILDRGYQSDHDLMQSIKYLDIYKEMTAYAQAKALEAGVDPEDKERLKQAMDEVVLRQEGEIEFTYANFMSELNAMKREMNLLIFNTHQREFRAQLADAENSYDFLFARVTPSIYPSLYNSLADSGIKPAIYLPIDRDRQRLVDLLIQFESTEFYTLDREELERLEKDLRLYPDLDPEGHYQSVLTAALKARQCYDEARHPELFAQAYLLEEISKLMDVPSEDSEVFAAKAKEAQKHIKERFDNAYDSPSPYEQESQALLHVLERPEHLRSYMPTKCGECFGLWEALSSDQKAVHAKDLTTYAVSLQRCIHHYLKTGEIDQAKGFIELALRTVTLTEHHPLNRLGEILASKDVVELSFDSSAVRRRKVRVCKKELPVEKGSKSMASFYEMRFEVPSSLRPALQALLVQGESLGLSFVEEPTVYESGARELQVRHMDYESKDLVYRGDLKEQLRVGNSQEFWPLYHQIKLRWPQEVPAQRIQELLCEIGLPPALMVSRDEDIAQEAHGRCVALNAPELI